MSNGSLLYQSQTQVLTQRNKIDNSQFNTHSFRSKNDNKFLKISQEDQMQMTLRNISYDNKIATQVLNDWDHISNNPMLMAGLSILKNSQLIQDKDVQIQKFTGKSRVKFVYNDYHQKNTNPGYSRNSLGCYYTR